MDKKLLNEIIEKTVDEKFSEFVNKTARKCTGFSVGRKIDNLVDGKLNESAFNVVLGLYGYPRYSNPITLQIGKYLNEAIITTYPTDVTVRYARDYFDRILKGFEVYDNPRPYVYIDEYKDGSGTKVIGVTSTVEPWWIKHVEKVMALCGYHKKSEVLSKQGETTLSSSVWEPTHIENCNQEIREKNNFLLHVTPMYNLKKILKFGLFAKSKNGKFGYPPRVYFFGEHTHMANIEYLIMQLSKDNENVKEYAKWKYALLKIDLSKVDDRVDFFKDNDCKGAYFSTEGIDPKAISYVTDIDAKDLTKETILQKYSQK